MKIGVVSDTHSKVLPQKMLSDFKGVDLILHAGDFCGLETLQVLKRINEVNAVYGNMDGSDLRKILPKSRIIELGDIRLGLFHGEGAPKNLIDTVKAQFKGCKVDAIIFGHSHHPMNEMIDGILFFNPGSSTDQVFAPYQSYGILEINGKKISGRIVKI
jgi:uncharacterized protein